MPPLPIPVADVVVVVVVDDDDDVIVDDDVGGTGKFIMCEDDVVDGMIEVPLAIE